MGSGDLDFLQELSEYLDVLSNSVRLKILKLVEKRPKDARTISHEIETSYENTKKHLDKLLSIGLIRKEAGVGRPTSKGVHPVWEYSLVPGALEAVTRSLALFSNTPLSPDHRVLSEKLLDVRGQFSQEFGSFPALIVMGGEQDGTVFFIKESVAALGREDPDAIPPPGGILVAVADSYRAVTRVSRPHARIQEEKGEYYLEDRGSTGGTFVDNTRLEKGERIKLEDGALIELARGTQGIRLLFVVSPSGKPAEEPTG